MALGSNNPFPSILVVEGSAPSSPASGNQRVYIDSADHHLKRKNSSGTVTDFEVPPGYKYSEVTYTDVSVTGTTEGGAQTVATSASIALDGVIGVYVEWYTPRLILGTAAGNGMVVDLYVDSTIQYRFGVWLNPAGAADDKPVFLKSGTLTPSNASHTFTVKAWRINANGTVSGGAGGSGTNAPGYIRVVKA